MGRFYKVDGLHFDRYVCPPSPEQRYKVVIRDQRTDVYRQQQRRLPLIFDLQAKGGTHRSIAAEMNTRGVRTARGGEWSVAQMQWVLARAS